MSDFTRKPSFCVAPWSSLYLGTMGERRLCCVSSELPPEVSSLGYKDFLQSDYMTNVRRQMMSGVLPKECALCVKSNQTTVYKDTLNERFKHLLPAITKFTDGSGAIQIASQGEEGLGIVSLDYRSIVCNFRCKTCSPEFSSSWISEISSHQADWQAFYPQGRMNELQKSISQSPYKSEFLDVVNAFPIEHIYFAGGEPFYSGTHEQAIDSLIASGRAKDITLLYNTNLSLKPMELVRWVKKWKSFKEVTLNCSLDGVASAGEYIRQGLRFNIFQENYRYLLSARSTGNLSVLLDATITSLFFLQIREFSEFILQTESKFIGKAMVLGNRKSKFMRCEFLPKRIRKLLVSEWRETYEALPENSRDLLVGLKSLVTYISEFDELPARELPAILKQIEVHDRQFPKEGKFSDFLCIHPVVSEWYTGVLKETGLACV